MNKTVFINLPVSDIKKSTEFYEALGFTQDPNFSDEHASSMQWSENVVFMLLSHDFYEQFLDGKTIADTRKTSAALIALSMDSKEDVENFAKTAKENGGSYRTAAPNEDMPAMCSYEVEDIDGNTLEPVWMNMEAFGEE